MQQIRHRKYYTWRDWLIGGYFAAITLLGSLGLNGNSRFFAYSVSSIIVGSIGGLAVVFKLKRVEAVMIVTWGLLLMARAILLMPDSLSADNTNVWHYVLDILHSRPLADGVTAFMPLIVLAAYCERRGRVTR